GPGNAFSARQLPTVAATCSSFAVGSVGDAARQHRAVHPGATRNSGGSSPTQRVITSAQRGWKAQPEGNDARSGGWPGIAKSGSLLPSFGIEPSRPLV